MKYLLAIATIAISTSLIGQQSLASFEHIRVTGNVKLTLVQGSSTQYEATGNLTNLKVDVVGGKLKISKKDLWKDSDRPAIVTVWYNDLQSLYGAAGSQVDHEGTLNANDLELSASTGASMDLTVVAQALEVHVGEGGVMRLDGSGRVLEASASTGAVLKARDFIAQRTYVKANTGAIAHVYAEDEIEASATLGGMVSYSGDPDRVRVKETLGGSVKG